MDADFAPILHQNNAILPRSDHIGMKKTPRSIADFRFHGTAPAARGKHTFGTGNSLWHQSHSWIFQLFPAHILTPINSPQAIRKPLTSSRGGARRLLTSDFGSDASPVWPTRAEYLWSHNRLTPHSHSTSRTMPDCFACYTALA